LEKSLKRPAIKIKQSERVTYRPEAP